MKKIILLSVISLFVQILTGNQTQGQEMGTETNMSLKSALASSNLTPVVPSGWDNRIVVSTSTGTHTSASMIFDTQDLYVDFSILNNGTVNITTPFNTYLYLDGSLFDLVTTTSLDANKAVTVIDFHFAKLWMGTHTLRIVTDPANVISEGNETDNEYTRTITVYKDYNLTPNQPAGWDNKIVISNVTGTNTSNTIYSTENIYLDWSVANTGTENISNYFRVTLFIDDVYKFSWLNPSLNGGNSLNSTDYGVGKLSPGNHTFRIVADEDGTV